jgi:hypothetical protein
VIGLILILCVGFALAQIGGVVNQFSRPTVKGRVLDSEPYWHRLVYEDATYRFVWRDYGNAEYVPGFFAQDLKKNRWLELTTLSTEYAQLGHAPDVNDIPLMVGWDFRPLATMDYAAIPLETGGSIVFPDRITFNRLTGIYRFDCNSALNREESLTSFWVRKADLDALR